MTPILTPRSVEALLFEDARRNPDPYSRNITKKGALVSPGNCDLGVFTVVDIQTDTDYDSYGGYYDQNIGVVLEDNDGRLFMLTYIDDSYGDTVSILSVRHVKAKPVDRIYYAPVN